MTNLIQVTTMKCDNDECDYITSDVDNSTVHKYLHKPCPKCGESLLTEDDLSKLHTILDLGDRIEQEVGRIAKDVLEGIENGFQTK